MYYKLKEQEKIIRGAIEKAGSYRKLSKILKTPLSSLTRYVKEGTFPEDFFENLIKFLEIEERDNLIKERLPDNFRQIIGGKNCVIVKKKKGTFKRDMKKLQNIQSKKLKKWHKFMKKNKPREYYLKQYSRFKKIGEYKYITKNGEKVRNLLEKQVADILIELNINYKYESLVNIGKKYFFPDFLIDNKIIIECTAWKGVEKAYKLKDKIEILDKKYKVFVIIPKALYSYYQILKNNLILGLDEFVPVAQTFLSKTS